MAARKTENPDSTGGKDGADGVQNIRENKRGKDSTAAESAKDRVREILGPLARLYGKETSNER